MIPEVYRSKVFRRQTNTQTYRSFLLYILRFCCSIKYVEHELHDKAVQELGLTALNKDDSITPDLMIQCCERLLLHKTVLAPLLEGVMLWVTHYYSVMSDGVLCIPWDWKL